MNKIASYFLLAYSLEIMTVAPLFVLLDPGYLFVALVLIVCIICSAYAYRTVFND